PRKVFRRSIAWLSNSLSTLRRAGYPVSTQDALPAVGQTLLDGLRPAGFLRKVSEVQSLHLFLLPQALLGAITSTQASTDTCGAPAPGHSLEIAIRLSPSGRERAPDRTKVRA